MMPAASLTAVSFQLLKLQETSFASILVRVSPTVAYCCEEKVQCAQQH